MATSTTSLSYTALDSGQYSVEVTGAAGSEGEYVLSVSGATGALPVLDVTQVNPAAGAYIQPPTSVTVDFSQSLNLSTLSAFGTDGPGFDGPGPGNHYRQQLYHRE